MPFKPLAHSGSRSTSRWGARWSRPEQAKARRPHFDGRGPDLAPADLRDEVRPCLVPKAGLFVWLNTLLDSQ
jgi:hypothetical protein